MTTKLIFTTIILFIITGLTIKRNKLYISKKCEKCNEHICETEPLIVFYNQCEFLKLLHSFSNHTQIDRSDSFTNQFCIEEQINLRGYIPTALYFDPEIIPNVNLNSIIDNNGHCFRVRALFQNINEMYMQNQSIELSDNYIDLTNSALSVNTITDPLPYITTAQLNNNGYFPRNLQFNELVPSPFNQQLDKIEVPYWELMELVRYSDYIGISGARVSSGNHMIDENNRGIYNACNKDYFTLKFTGFRDGGYFTFIISNGQKIKYIKMVPNNYFAQYQRDTSSVANRIQSKSMVPPPTGNRMIPGTVWGSPCPPVWIPQ